MIPETPARPPHLGLHHVALFVGNLSEARRFYVDLLGFRVEWEPDADNLYLTSGSDNLALHQAKGDAPTEPQRLDHIGICCPDVATVDRWHAWLAANTVRITQAPRRHRDGAYSFYCLDYDNVRVQFIHHPPITRALIRAQDL